MRKKNKIFIAGHNGLVGDAFYRIIKEQGYKKIIIADKKKLDLTNKQQVFKFFKKNKIDILLICAAKVGGIMSNSRYPYEFLKINTDIQNNLLEAARKFKIKKTMFLGSSCIYPKNAKNPIKEDYLLSGYLEKTNEAYALSKIAGLKFSEYLIKQHKMDIRCFMPCNLFGFKDKFFDVGNNHVLPALIHRIYEAKINNKKKFVVWGDGSPRREFMHADVLAKNIINAMKISKKKFYKNISSDYFYNIGSKTEISIINLTRLIAKLISYNGKVYLDKSKPNGTLRKFMSKSKIKKILKVIDGNFEKDLKKTINHYIKLRKFNK